MASENDVNPCPERCPLCGSERIWSYGLAGPNHHCQSCGGPCRYVGSAAPLRPANHAPPPEPPATEPGWLIEGLRDAQREADANPELRKRVDEHPSGFLPKPIAEPGADGVRDEELEDIVLDVMSRPEFEGRRYAAEPEQRRALHDFGYQRARAHSEGRDLTTFSAWHKARLAEATGETERRLGEANARAERAERALADAEYSCSGREPGESIADYIDRLEGRDVTRDGELEDATARASEAERQRDEAGNVVEAAKAWRLAVGDYDRWTGWLANESKALMRAVDALASQAGKDGP